MITQRNIQFVKYNGKTIPLPTVGTFAERFDGTRAKIIAVRPIGEPFHHIDRGGHGGIAQNFEMDLEIIEKAR